MATAEAGAGREPPGLGPRTRRSTATGAMAGCGGGGEEEQREGPVPYVLALPVVLPLSVAVSRLDAAVPRKARTYRPCAKPTGWWAFRMPVVPPEEVKLPGLPPGEAKENPAEEARSPGARRPRVRLRVTPRAPDLDAAAAPATKKPAKRCLQCGSADTPQWRSGPMGWSPLCNACGVRLRKAGALREPEHRPTLPTARTVAEPPPPGSRVSDSPPDSPIWEPRAPPRDVYLVRKPSQRTRPPRKQSPPAPAPAVYLVKKPAKKPYRPKKTGKTCLHCGSTSTPQWREGPMGRATLCNACGVRYRQGRLLPEYRPAASPSFVPSEHANLHRAVLELHRQRQDKDPREPPSPEHHGDDPAADALELDKAEYPPTPLHRPLPPQSLAGELRARSNDDSADALAGGGDGGNDAAEVPSSLDSMLLEGPSAPLIVDGEESLMS